MTNDELPEFSVFFLYVRCVPCLKIEISNFVEFILSYQK
jgi:hypothetical protein